MRQKRGFLKSGVLVLFTLIAAAFIATYAMAGDSKFSYLEKTDYRVTKRTMNYYLLPSGDSNGQCVKGSLKVLSGKECAGIKLEKLNGKLNILMSPKKAGTIKFRFKYKEGKKTTSHTLSIKLVKYVCPVSKVTLGSKDLTSRLKSSFYCGIKGNKLSGKINVKAGKGWKLENIFLFDNHNPGKQIKNGSKVTLKKGAFLNITLKDKNGIPNDLTVALY